MLFEKELELNLLGSMMDDIDTLDRILFISINQSALGLGKLCWHNFEHNGSQINVSRIEHNTWTQFEILTHLRHLLYMVRRVVYTGTSHVIFHGLSHTDRKLGRSLGIRL